MYSPKKPYSPTRPMFPRRFCEPSRLIIVIVVILLLFFFRLEAPSLSSTVPSPRDGAAVAEELERQEAHGLKAPTPAPGFRPLNQSRIAMVTFTTDQKSYTHLSLKNKAFYAKKHGYDFIVDFESHNNRGMMWHKFDMVQRVINGSEHDWVWWMDFDTLITNTNIKIEDIIQEALANVTNPDEVDWLFTPDCFELNAGSFLTRATPRAHSFISRTLAYHTANATQEHQLSEQDCMRDILFQSADFEGQFKMLPQWKINAFPKEIKCYDHDKRKWERGMFVLHFAGAWAHVKEEDPTGLLMRKYESQIIWKDEEV